MRACSALFVLLVVLTLTSCDKSNSAATAPSSGDSAAEFVQPTISEITRRDASDFKLGDYLPPLDGDKIEIAVPAGWEVMPRDRDFVVRFNEESNSGLPRIDVTVDDNNLGGLTSVTEANLVEFTAAVAKDLEASVTVLLEPPIPMVLGAVPCARYVSRVKLKIGGGTKNVERQTLVLLQAGRLYKINLLVDKLEESKESRDAAYAVCAGVRFLTAESPTTE